ncbi:MAG: hypothetical protein Q9193_006893, partial [Seirophora villosa]
MASEVPPQGFQSGDLSQSELAGEHRAHIHPSFNQSPKAHDHSGEQQAWVKLESFSFESDSRPTPTSTYPRYPLQANESSRSAKRSPLKLTSSAIQPSLLPIQPSVGRLANITKHSSTQEPFNSTTRPSDLAEQRSNPDPLTPEQRPTSAAEAGRAFRADQAKQERSASNERLEDAWSRESTEEMSGPASPTWVQERLEQHNMFEDNGSELRRFPELIAEVDRIISAKRKSNATRKEFEDFQATFQLYRNQNEATVLAAVLPCIIKDDRTVLIPSKDHSQEAVWESVKFFNEGIMIILDREFKKGYVPYRNGIEEVDVQLVAQMTKLKDRGMANPKPDRTFGIRRDKYRFPPGFQMPEEIRDFLEVLPEMHLPFLIIEGKAEGGGSAEARNQACRGGAAL